MSELVYETERLLVRHFRFEDLEEFALLCADPQVMRYVGDGQPLPRSEVERWIAVCQQKYAERGYGTSAVFEKATGRLVGYCGVVRAPGTDYDELIYVYHADTWGKGYATEAARAMLDHVFSRSSLARIRATIHPRNATSVRVAEQLGFRFDHTVIDDDGLPVSPYTIERPMSESRGIHGGAADSSRA